MKPLKRFLIPSESSFNANHHLVEIWASNEEIQMIRSKPHEEFMQLLRSMFATLLNCIEGSQRQNVIFMEVLEAVQSVRMVPQIPTAD